MINFLYFSLIEACRSSIHKMIRMLFTIEQLLLDVNPNSQNNIINLNVPIATPERLQEFNKLITEDSIASLQYVSTCLSHKYRKNISSLMHKKCMQK